MKKMFSINGREIIVEDGKININGNLVSGYQILPLNQAPRPVQDAIRKNNIDVTGRVYFGGAVVPREIAECALEQHIEIQTAEKRALNINVPGLDLLRETIDDIDRYHREFNQMMEDEYNDGVNPPKYPTYNIDAQRKLYPRAAAYLKAEAWEMASNYAKSAAGRKAKEAIAAGADIETTMATMEAGWSAHCQEHIWD